MAYYEPAEWISQDDRLDSEVEEVLKIPKRAFPRRVGSGKSFVPPSAIELDISVKDKTDVLRLTEWEDKQGRVFVNLEHAHRFFRKGHFNSGWHHNPDKRDIPPPHHVHFPTMRYPNLDYPSTYAYPLSADSDYLSALVRFCEDINIEIHGVSIPLLRR